MMCREDVNIMSQRSQFHGSVHSKPLRTTCAMQCEQTDMSSKPLRKINPPNAILKTFNISGIDSKSKKSRGVSNFNINTKGTASN
jgi:hypothetical protein